MPACLFRMCFLTLLLLALTSEARAIRADNDIRFGQDILPILSTNCFACHGPDASVRQANLRLDQEADAKARHDSGIPIVDGNTVESTLVQRITSDDPDVKMPPPDSHKELTPKEIEMLQKWIGQGAVWGRHWSFEPVARSAVSSANQATPIDVIVELELDRHKLTLRPSAAPQVLVRRLWLDLIGLPPTPEVADRFAADSSPAAYEKIVDDLLDSPRFGEHWARMWMDLARYADTKGYEKDLGRTVWPYRDWLVNSINADMPLDQMTREQLAGDLLPAPTTDQLVATAFHRNTMSNDEGGTDDEEFRTIAVKDRVDTTMQVWMGLTVGCAKCHSHKYDPISQQEYYSLFAVFNQTQDADRFDDSPTLEVISPSLEAERRKIMDRLDLRKKQLAEAEAEAQRKEDARWQFGAVETATSANGATLDVQPDHSIVASAASPAEDVYTVTVALQPVRHSVLRIEAIPEKFPDGQVGVGRNPKDPNFVLSELEVELLLETGAVPVKLTRPRADYSQDNWPVSASLDGDIKTGWAVSPRQRERHVALFTLAEPLSLDAATSLRLTMRQHYGDRLTLRRFRISTIDQDAATEEFPAESPVQRKLIDAIAAANKELQMLNGTIPKIPVLRAVSSDKARTTRIHRRGNFLDPGEEVFAGLPAAFHRVPANVSIDRLVMAEWLMSPENSLTPRVWANRIWARLFGQGIVATEEDFGALGALPSHPVLLDWLAAEYRDNGWSLKKLLKTIVMSRAYRQTSDVTKELRTVDPQNNLISRGARFRLSAETVRDQALAVSGLLSEKTGGPPVMPPQPDGLWRSTYNGQKWVNAEGEDRFRRALYTYLKRTTPYPSMTTFDGGSGEVCQIRRIRTNTPLQALVTLNDPVYLEAAGALAAQMVVAPGDVREKILFGLRKALIRAVRDGEPQPLERLQADIADSFVNETMKAASLIQSTRAIVPDGISAAEFASWIVVANTILNLDEFLTRN